MLWSSARVGAGLIKGFDTEVLLAIGDSTGIAGAGFAGVSRACSSVSSIRLGFTARVFERGNLTRGCLGGGGSPARHSSPVETDPGDRGVVVISETGAKSALVLSSCSSSASRLGEIISRFKGLSRMLVLPSKGMTNGDSQGRKTIKKVCSDLIANLLLSA